MKPVRVPAVIPFQPVPYRVEPGFVDAPKYKPRNGLAEKARARIAPLTKQRRDFQKERLKPRPPIQVETFLTKQQLAVKNAKRREKRNSDGFAFDADCVQRPSAGAGAAARWDPTQKQKADQKSRTKKHQHARKWC